MIGTRGRALIRRFEACRLEAYLDAKGIATIGYGRTAGVGLSDRCTKDEAEQWLLDDLAETERAIIRLVRVRLTESMKDALGSWVYNLGASRLAESTMLEVLNSGHYLEAAQEMVRWWRTKGAELGLLRRRLAEASLFLEDGIP